MAVENAVFLSGKMPISFLDSLCYTYFCSNGMGVPMSRTARY